jgi:hypothetical protein
MEILKHADIDLEGKNAVVTSASFKYDAISFERECKIVTDAFF